MCPLSSLSGSVGGSHSSLTAPRHPTLILQCFPRYACCSITQLDRAPPPREQGAGAGAGNSSNASLPHLHSPDLSLSLSLSISLLSLSIPTSTLILSVPLLHLSMHTAQLFFFHRRFFSFSVFVGVLPVFDHVLLCWVAGWLLFLFPASAFVSLSSLNSVSVSSSKGFFFGMTDFSHLFTEKHSHRICNNRHNYQTNKQLTKQKMFTGRFNKLYSTSVQSIGMTIILCPKTLYSKRMKVTIII